MLTLILQLLVTVSHLLVVTESPPGHDAASREPHLLQVTLLFRHGDRTPMRRLPLDPHPHVLGSLGAAQLLDEGVRQHYRLGAWLRRRYGNWLPRRFNVATMRVRSTDTDRTLMSAQANIAGLFPDQCSGGGERSDADMPPCYPVPIPSEPKDTDQLLRVSSPCANYERHWREFRDHPSGPYAAALAEFDWLIRVARSNAGFPADGDDAVASLWKLADSVAVWRRMGLQLPAWMTGSVLDGLVELKRRKFVWRFEEPRMHRAAIGLLVARVLSDMRDRLGGASLKQLQMYSAHDGTLAAFLHAFRVYNGIQPPTGGCIIAELYSNGAVQLLYKNTTGPGDAHTLSVPFCPAPCHLDRLMAEMRFRGVWAETAEQMCG